MKFFVSFKHFDTPIIIIKKTSYSNLFIIQIFNVGVTILLAKPESKIKYENVIMEFGRQFLIFVKFIATSYFY